MEKVTTVLLSLLLIGAAILPFAVGTGNAASGDAEYLIKSSVKFTAPSVHGWNLTEEDKIISLYMNTSWQTVSLNKSSQPLGTIKTDEDGNKVAILNMSNIQANESSEYTVSYDVISKPRNLLDISPSGAKTLSDIPQNLTATYLNDTETWMTNNPTLQNLASSLKGSEIRVLVIVENFVSWIWKNIAYPYNSTHEFPFYPNETLASKSGDCDDQAILLISLSRIVGIPAYLQIGAIYRPDITNESSLAWGGHIENIQNRIGWHGWAMVYVPPWGWLPFDLTYIPSSHKNDPLSAHKDAAVMMQDTVQYMNFIQTDYVAEARKYKNFLTNNDLRITTYDDMTLKQNSDPLGFITESLNTANVETLLILGIIVSVAGVLLCVKHNKSEKSKSLPR